MPRVHQFEAETTRSADREKAAASYRREYRGVGTPDGRSEIREEIAAGRCDAALGLGLPDDAGRPSRFGGTPAEECGIERNIFTMAAIADVSGLKRRLTGKPDEAHQLASIEPASDDVTPLHVGCAIGLAFPRAQRMTDQVQAAAALLDRGAEPDAVARSPRHQPCDAAPLALLVIGKPGPGPPAVGARSSSRR